MIEKLKQNNIMKVISIAYLGIFCILKVLALTNIFENLFLNKVMFGIGCIIIFAILIKKKGKLNYSNLLMIFISLVILNVFFYPNMATIKQALFEIFYVFVVYNIAKEYLEEKEYNKIIGCILIITFILVSVFFLQYIVKCLFSGINDKGIIAHLVFSNINGGAILVLLNIVMINYMYRIQKLNKGLTIFLSFYYIIFIVISMARASQLAFAILVVYWLYNHFFQFNKNNKWKKVLKNIIILTTIFIILVSLPLILKRNYDLKNKTDQFIYSIEQKLAKFTTLRYWLWKYSIQELVDTNVLFGLKADFGKDSFQNINNADLLNTLSESQQEILQRSNLHNGYIQILVENGILGFIAMITFFIKFAKKILKLDNSNSYNQYIKYLYLVYIFVNLFENDIILSNTFFVLFLWLQIGKDSNLINDNELGNEIGEK